MLKAVITTLVLTSTAALADTPYPDTYSDDYRGEYRGDTYQPRYDSRYERNYDERFDDRASRRHRVMLANNAVLASRQGALWVPIDPRVDISRVRVRLASGRALVRNVTLVYADGHRETMQVDRWLTSDQPTLTVELAHGGVRGILIDSQQQRRYARGGGWRRLSTATVDVIGLRR
jgi:hypothetical protein